MGNQPNIRELIKEEYKKCASDNVHFFKRYSIIQHPIKGKINFNLYEFQEETLKQFQKYRFNIVLKSRQMGISTLVSGYGLYKMLFQDDFKVLVIANKQDVAKNIIEKVKLMHSNLPVWMRQETITENKTELVFKNGSSIKAVASSPSAGRSEALSLLIVDEAAFCESFAEIWTSAQMTLATGGDAIVLSTPKGVGNQFHKMWVQADAGIAEEGMDKFNPICLKWDLHPDRDENWRRQQTELLGERKAAQECDCLWGQSEVTVRNVHTGVVKTITLSELYAELQPLLHCKICGYTGKQLSQHIINSHGINTSEYKSIYGIDSVMQVGFNPIKPEIDSKTSNTVKQTYLDLSEKLINIDILPLEDVVNLLKNDNYYLKFFGKAKYRTLIKENIKLYKSIIEYTSTLDEQNLKFSFSDRILFILDYNLDITRLWCKCKRRLGFKSNCRRCSPKYPSMDWFIFKYGKDLAKVKYTEWKGANNKSGMFTKDWFRERYGVEHYLEKYDCHYNKRFNNCNYAGYSKISQALFIELQRYIPDLTEFALGSGERKIYLTKSERVLANQIVYLLDLHYKGKNIEFDGSYWHKDPNLDLIRDSILRSRGIVTLRITDDEYKSDKNLVIQKCLEFLNG